MPQEDPREIARNLLTATESKQPPLPYETGALAPSTMQNYGENDAAGTRSLNAQKDAAVNDVTQRAIDEDRRRRDETRTNLIRAGVKNPDAELQRLMGAPPTPAARAAMQTSAGAGNTVTSTPRGIEGGVTDNVNYSAGRFDPTPEPQAAAAPAGPPPSAAMAASGPPAPAYPPARFVPGQFVPHSRSMQIQGGAPVSDETRDAFYGADKQRTEAITEGADYQQQGHNQIASGWNRMAMNQAILNNQAQANEQRRQATVNHAMDALAKLTEASHGDVDMEKARDVGLGTKLAAMGASFLGGFSEGFAAIKGGHVDGDGALRKLDKIVADNIAEQQSKIANSKGKLEDVRGYVSELRKSGLDERQAEAGAMAASYKEAESEFQAVAERAKNPATKAQALEALAGVRDRRAEWMRKLEETSANRVTTSSSEAYVPGHMVGGAPAASNIDPKLLVHAPDGRTIVARTEEEARGLRGKVGMTSNIQANLNEALKLRQQLSVAHPIDSAKLMARLESLQAETAQLVTVARGQGAMSKGDQDVADHAIGNMTSLNPLSGADDVLRTTSARIGQQLDRDLAAQAAPVAQTGYGVTAQGAIAPTATYTGRDKTPAPQMPSGFKPAGGQ